MRIAPSQRQKIKKKASKATVGQTVVTTMENEAGEALGWGRHWRRRTRRVQWVCSGTGGEAEWLELSECWEREGETAPTGCRRGPQGTRKVPGRSRTLDAWWTSTMSKGHMDGQHWRASALPQDNRQRSYYEERPRGWLPLPYPRANCKSKGKVLIGDI